MSDFSIEDIKQFVKQYKEKANKAIDNIPIIGAINRFTQGDTAKALANGVRDAKLKRKIQNKIEDKANELGRKSIKTASQALYLLPKNTRISIARAARNYGTGLNIIESFVNSPDDGLIYLKDGDPGRSFLLTDKEQEEYMKQLGYFKTQDDDGIKIIKKATDALKKYRGDDKINIYQIGKDVIPRDSVIPVSPEEAGVRHIGEYYGNTGLKHAQVYNRIYYKHKNPNIKKYYFRDIDLNDYGNHNNHAGATYDYANDSYNYNGLISKRQSLANMYDLIGNPFIQKTGITEFIPKTY